jgi:hypothetical protein
MEIQREQRDTAWRFDAVFDDEVSGPFIIRGYLTTFEGDVFLHWKSTSYVNPFRLYRIRHQRYICRSILSSLHINEMATMASERESEFTLKFQLYNFRIGEIPMSSRETIIDMDEDFDVILDKLSKEMSDLIMVYRSISLQDRTLPADRHNSVFQPARLSTVSESVQTSSVDAE